MALITATTIFGTYSGAYPNGVLTASNFGGIASLAIDKVNHNLFVSDTTLPGYNSRILVFKLNSDNSWNGSPAFCVLGAPNFTTEGIGGPAQNQFGQSFCNICIDNKNLRLFVSDVDNSCVLCFDIRPSVLANYQNAIFILGASSFSTSNPGSCAQNKLDGPDDIAYDEVNDRLFVSDAGNNRVMCWSVPPGSGSALNGTNATFVLGQSTWTGSSSGHTQSTLNTPAGVSYDPVNARSFVSDHVNNRVMCFSVPAGSTSSINGENATFVLGQSTWTGNSTATTQAGLNAPDDNCYDPGSNQLFVGDYGNVRVIVWTVPGNATSSFNGSNATQNIGQSSWTAVTPGNFPNESPNSGFDGLNNRLWSYAAFGHQIYLHEFVEITNTVTSLPFGQIGTAYSPQQITIANNNGASQTYSISSGALPAGLAINSSTGVISGTPVETISAAFTVEVADNFTGTGAFVAYKSFVLNTGYSAPAASAGAGGTIGHIGVNNT